MTCHHVVVCGWKAGIIHGRSSNKTSSTSLLIIRTISVKASVQS